MNLEPDLKELHVEYHDETSFRNYVIKVEQDDMTESPREWDNLGTMVCWHRNYDLGDVNGGREYSDKDLFWLELSGLDLDDDNGYFTDEQRTRQAERCRAQQPWKHSTGPNSKSGRCLG